MERAEELGSHVPQYQIHQFEIDGLYDSSEDNDDNGVTHPLYEVEGHWLHPSQMEEDDWRNVRGLGPSADSDDNDMHSLINVGGNWMHRDQMEEQDWNQVL